eukprot:scaffold28196_cov55-Attheya_sp.AAC.2
MTYMVVYMDGDQTMALRFTDEAGFLRWEAINHEIKDEASRIIAECPCPEHLTPVNVQAIRIWLQHIDAMVEAGTPVLPSILSAMDNFVRVIADM